MIVAYVGSLARMLVRELNRTLKFDYRVQKMRLERALTNGLKERMRIFKVRHSHV